jgi:hypothetical protein
MTITHSYPPNRFAFPDSPQEALVRAPRPSPAPSGRALSNKDGPGDAQSIEQVGAQAETTSGAQIEADVQTEVRSEARADGATATGRPVLHLNGTS